MLLIKSIFKSIGLSAFYLLSSTQVADAVCAKKGIFTYFQPDGSQVEVILGGDEYFHYYTTSDGLPLVEDIDGTLYFARMQNGMVENSGFKACNPNMRPSDLQNIVGRVDIAEVRKRLYEQTQSKVRRRALPQEGMGRFETTFPTGGAVRALVVLVEYSDVKFEIEEPARYFTDLLNKDGFDEYGATGCAREYFLDSSNGLFDLQCDVYGPVSLPRPRSYYGGNDMYGQDSNPEDMVVHAIELLDEEVDFSMYDCDKDGILDNVFVFYAGRGEASGGPSSSVWPHAWELRQAGKAFTADGVLVDHYACTNEMQGNIPDGIGTFCHEFSHIMGLPDLYDTSGYGSKTPGEWSVMDYGPYNNNSRTPPTYSAFERNAMGWLDVVAVSEACSVELSDIKQSNSAVLIATSRKNEFYLFENRQQTSWDKYLPGHGMLVWRIDYDASAWRNNVVNNDRDHQRVDLVEASGEYGEVKDAAWPGSIGKHSFTAKTEPAFVDWNGKSVELPLTDIEESEGKIYFSVDGGDFELLAPMEFKIDEVTPISAKLSWKASQRARGYKLSVWSQEGLAPEYVNGFREHLYASDELSAEVTGLKADTEYMFELKAISGTRESTPVQITVITDEMSFPYMKPEVLPAQNVGEDAFTAHWAGVEGASAYLLTVEGVVDRGDCTENCDFGSLIFRVPQGWIYSQKTSKYTDPDWCGVATPSAKMDTDGAYLESPRLGNDVKEISFWCRVTTGAKGSVLRVEGLAEEQWISIEDFELTSSAGTSYRVDKVPDGIKCVRLTFIREGSGSLALDDVTIIAGGISRTPIPEYIDADAGSGTSYLVEGLPEGQTGFYYKIRAVSDSELHPKS